MAAVWCKRMTMYEVMKMTENFISTGYTELDNLLGGGFPNGLIIVKSSRTGYGKTSFVSNLIKNFAFKSDHGNSALFFSFEMDKKSIIDRFISMISGIPYKALITAQLTEKHWEDFELGYKELESNNPIFMYYNSLSIYKTLDYITLYKRCKKAGLVVVDNLNYFKEKEKYAEGDARSYQIGRNAALLNYIAEKMNIPIIATMQFRDKELDKELGGVANVMLTIDYRDDTKIKITTNKTSRHVTLKADWDYWRFENV